MARHGGIEGGIVAAAVCALVLSLPALAQYREYYIHGKVVDTGKQPIAGVEIVLRDVATSRSFHMTTGKDGAFKFAGLPHGIYEATLTRAGYPTTKVEWKFEARQDTMQRVDVPEIVLASQEQVQKVAERKQAESGIKEAAERIRQGDFDGAIPQLRGLLDKSPNDADALYFLGLSYAGKQMYREAVDALTKVTELSPGFAAAHFQLGVCHQRLHDAPGALAAYERSLAIDPSHSDSAYNAGLILFEMNRVDEALARFEQGLASRPQDPDLLEMAARCYIHQAKLERALESLQKARGATADPAKAAFLNELIAKLKAEVK